MNIFYKFYLIYFMIIIPIMGYNNRQSLRISSIDLINTDELKVPMFLKLWLLTEFILS